MQDGPDFNRSYGRPPCDPYWSRNNNNGVRPLLWVLVTGFFFWAQSLDADLSTTGKKVRWFFVTLAKFLGTILLCFLIGIGFLLFVSEVFFGLL